MIGLTYKWSFERDPATGEMRERVDALDKKNSAADSSKLVNVQSELTQAPTVDKHVRDTIHHARELASASDLSWPINTGNRFHAKRKWYYRRRVSIQKQRLSLREIAFAALSVGVTLGAVLITVLHFFLFLVPSENQLSLEGTSKTNVMQTNGLQVQMGNAKFVETALSQHAIIVPAITTLMYEDGVFSTLGEAQSALHDVSNSGVDACISETAPYHLLLGPVLRKSGDVSFNAWLTRAEVPFYVQPYTISEQMYSLPPSTHSAIGAQVLSQIETLVVLDTDILQALIAENSQYQVKDINSWITQSSNLASSLHSSIAQLGGMGTNILTYHSAVSMAVDHVNDILNPNSDIGKVLLVKALLAAQKIT